jgi:septal ring-binding cell division protein DamX
MKSKDFREIQVSSSLLAVIFLCVLALGVFIFLLGVSVGKKQVRMAAAAGPVAERIQELPVGPATEPSVTAQAPGLDKTGPPAAQAAQPSDSEKAEIREPQNRTPASAAAKPEAKGQAGNQPGGASGALLQDVSGSGLYYVQVAAFRDQSSALAEAEKFRKRGYTAVVPRPRPTDTNIWYRVRLGGYPSRAQAADLLKKLNAAAGGKTDFQVVKD